MTDLYQVNLKKQTIAQLTALCREHKLSGYSKLKKAALVEKLEAYRDRPKASVPVTNVHPSDLDPAEKDSQQNSPVLEDALESAPSVGPTALVQTVPNKVAPQINHNEKPVHLKNASKPLNLTSSKILPNADTRFIASVATPLSSISNISLPAAKFLKPNPSITPVALPKKRPSDHLPVSIVRPPKKRLLNPVNDSRTSTALFLTPKPHAIPVQGAQTVLPQAEPVARKPLPRDIIRTGKRRFVPLKAKQTPTGGPVTSIATLPSCSPGILQPYLVDKDYDAPLSNISIPPSLSQRKRVKGLALILRDLSDADRQTCCFASRALRYAVYVSAQFVLCQEFPGKRTDALLSRAQDCFTNMWPYLIYRRQEKARLKRLYETSFLSRFVPNPMSERLWGNPDTGNEVCSALRFTLSRLWFTVSLFGDSGRHFLKEFVSDVVHLAGDEIWEITVREGDTVSTLLVLGLTGEPIGCQHLCLGSSRFIRSDWRHYMESASSVNARRSLWENLRCANEEEFVEGIGKLWIQGVEREGDVGATKRRVAERYVMASVVANSVSGEQMTHLQMSMQTAGISLGGTNRAQSSNAINLFLSEHHHVESVHFVSSSGRPFHPAVASVQTPHREYFVLRENGLQIGCEEDGVSETWMGILGVLRDGSPCS